MKNAHIPCMQNRESKHSGFSRALILLCTAALAGCLLLGFLLLPKTVTYERSSEILYNPYCGLAPMADDPDAVGENTLVYVSLTWKEWEPQKDVYDVQTVWEENHLDRWQQEGKKVVLRFVCDIPGTEAHRDIPDWLYAETGDGTAYVSSYGKGYSPNYENAILIAEHAKAVQALGSAFEKNGLTAYVELGSLGHWGEWHVDTSAGIPSFPSEQIAAEYVEPYLTAFTSAQLLMRLPFSFVKEDGMGLYNDMTGDEEATEEWLDWIEEGGSYEEPVSVYSLTAVPDVWKQAPIGGEFTSGTSMDEMLEEDLYETLELLADSHMTFIGPMIASVEEQSSHPDAMRQISSFVGYRYGVSSMKMTKNLFTGMSDVEITLTNFGTAPMYQDWPVMLDELDEEGQVVSKTKLAVSLLDLCGSSSTTVHAQMQESRLAIEIDDPATMEPAVHMDMAGSQDTMVYTLYK